MGNPSRPIQREAVARLRGDAPLATLLGSPTNPPGAIFDNGGAATNSPYPLIIVWPILSESGTALSMGTDAVDVYVQISVWTQSGGVDAGFDEAEQIAARIYGLFQPPADPLDLSGYGFTNFFLLFQNQIPGEQDDGQTQKIDMRFKLMNVG